MNSFPGYHTPTGEQRWASKRRVSVSRTRPLALHAELVDQGASDGPLIDSQARTTSIATSSSATLSNPSAVMGIIPIPVPIESETTPATGSLIPLDSNDDLARELSHVVSNLVRAGGNGHQGDTSSNPALSNIAQSPDIIHPGHTIPIGTTQVTPPEGSYAIVPDRHDRPLSLESRRSRTRLVRLPVIGRRSRRASFEEHTTSLRDRLQVAISTSCGLQKRFLPASALSILLSQDAVAAELLRHRDSPRKLFGILSTTSDEERARQVQSICGIAQADLSYRKILTILLLIERPERIVSFIESKVSDTDLPLLLVPRKKDPNGATFKLRRSRDPGTPIPFLKWKQSAVTRFEEHQWTVLAPLFLTTTNDPVPHISIPCKCPLPFIAWERAAERGACGQVFKVTIHPAHHNFLNTEVPDGIVAVKQLFSKKRERFEQEVEILKRISQESHTNKHLIKLLATYEHNNEYHIIFPYAPRDLETYWKLENPNPVRTGELAHWLVNQCQGLAEGLAKIHRYGTESPNAFIKVDSKMNDTAPKPGNPQGSTDMHWFLGRHGDIKPENILWFPQGSHGILKITDFGIARFTAQNQQAQRRRGYPPNSVTYRSPECDDPNGQLTGMCDVWALGCVYLVFVTWFTGGYDAVKKFAEARKAIDDGWHGLITDSFFTVQDGEARVKDSVVTMMMTLKSESSSTMSEVVSIAERKMLIVHGRSCDQDPLAAAGPGPMVQNRRKSSREVSIDMGSLKDDIRPTTPGLRRSETQETWVSVARK